MGHCGVAGKGLTRWCTLFHCLLLQVKSNTLRGEEQMHKNALRSLREYVDTAKGNRRNFNHLSSSSETALGGGGEGPPADHLTTTTAPRPVRQLSNASEPLPPDSGGEGNTEKEGVSSLVLNGSTTHTHTHPPDPRGVAPRTEDAGGNGGGAWGRQGEVATPTPHTNNTRTYSESSATTATSLQSGMPSKSTTAPPTSEEDERRGSVSSSKNNRTQNFSSFSSMRVTPETTEGTLSISSSQASTVLLSDATTPSHMHVNLSAASLPPHESVDERKKSTRSKPARQKPLKLELREVTSENLVNCTLNSRKGQVDFRFSTKSKYDKPDSIFLKLVSELRREEEERGSIPDFGWKKFGSDMVYFRFYFPLCR